MKSYFKMNTPIKLFSFITFVLLLCYGTGAGFVYTLNRQSCLSKADMMRMPASYGIYRGCMVQTKTGWMPIDAVRAIQ